MRPFSYYLILGVVLSLVQAQAETPKSEKPPSFSDELLKPTRAPEVRKLSLEECIEIALQHNLDVQIKRFGPEVSRFSLGASYGLYDPGFLFSGEHDYNQSPGGIDAQGRQFAGTLTESDTLRSSLNGLLPWGLNYSVGGSVSDVTQPTTVPDTSRPTSITATKVYTNFNDLVSENTNFVFRFNTNYASMPAIAETTSGSVGFMTLRQPLLKNFWIDSTRLQIFINRQNLKGSELDLRLQLMSTITAVEEAYYNLIFSAESVEVQKKAVELAERLVAENKKRVEVGTLAPLDEKQAESQAASARADLLQAESVLGTQQRVLKNLLSDNYANWESVSIQPSATLLAVAQSFDLHESWGKGLRQRPDVLQARINLEKQNYVVRFQRNQLYPDLELTGTYGYNGAGKEFGDAFDQISRGNAAFYSFGAQVSIPLSSTATRNNYRAAKATRQQSELQLKQTEQAALILIENAIAVARSDYQRVEATREARRFAEAALDAEEKKLESGKSTSFQVLQLQKDLTTAASAEIRALADYNNALAEIALNEGTTLERRGVKLEVK